MYCNQDEICILMLWNFVERVDSENYRILFFLLEYKGSYLALHKCTFFLSNNTFYVFCTLYNYVLVFVYLICEYMFSITVICLKLENQQVPTPPSFNNNILPLTVLILNEYLKMSDLIEQNWFNYFKSHVNTKWEVILNIGLIYNYKSLAISSCLLLYFAG